MKRLIPSLMLSAFAAAFLGGCIDSGIYPTGPVHSPYPRPTSQASHMRPSPQAYRPSAGLPADFREYKERYARQAVTPEGAVKMYFDAVFSYISGNKAEGLKMIRYSLHETKGWNNTGYHSTFMERLKDPRCHHIFRSFAVGSSPENDYAMSPNDYRLDIYGTRAMPGYVQVQLVSSGADSLRTVQVRQHDDGLWYVMQNAGTYTQVREPYSVRQQKMYRHDADYD